MKKGTIIILAIVAVAIIGLGINTIPNIVHNKNELTNMSVYMPEETEISENEDGVKYVNDIIVVYFNAGVSDKEIKNVAKSVDGQIVGGCSEIDQYQIRVAKSDYNELENMCEKLAVNENVADVVCDYIMEDTEETIPDDPWSTDSTYATWDDKCYGGDNWWAKAIDLPTAWDEDYNKIKVGVLDNGFDCKHEDLNGVITEITNDVVETHGTHVAGIIAAKHDNGKGISGVNPNCEIIGSVYETVNNKNYTTTTQIASRTAELISNGCKVVNISMGLKIEDNTPLSIMESWKKSSGRAAGNTVSALLARGYDFVIVQSAGNGTTDSRIPLDSTYNGNFCSIDTSTYQKSQGITLEDVQDHIIIVGAAKDDQDGTFSQAYFSNGGFGVDLCAPGYDILSCVPGGYKKLSGTSMAAPIVSGIASLVWAKDNTLSGGEVKEKLCNNTKYRVDPDSNNPVGSELSMVNAALALNKNINDNSSFSVLANSYTSPNPNFAGGTSKYIITIYDDGTFTALESKTEVKGTNQGFVTFRSNGHGKLNMLQDNTDLYAEISIDSLEYDITPGEIEYENGDEIKYSEFTYLHQGKKFIVYKEGNLIADLPISIQNQILGSNTYLFGAVLYDSDNDRVYWSQESIDAY